MLKKCLGMIAVATAILVASPAWSEDFDFFGLAAPSQKIVINAKKRQLSVIYSDGRVKRYPVAVPKAGKEWSGTTYIDGMYEPPDWSPPAVVSRDHPELPKFIPGGSSRNPMGARAITLGKDEVAIHGTTKKMR